MLNFIFEGIIQVLLMQNHNQFSKQAKLACLLKLIIIFVLIEPYSALLNQVPGLYLGKFRIIKIDYLFGAPIAQPSLRPLMATTSVFPGDITFHPFRLQD